MKITVGACPVCGTRHGGQMVLLSDDTQECDTCEQSHSPIEFDRNARQPATTHNTMTTTEPTADELAGMTWWNNIDEDERAYWLAEAKTAIAAEAWAEYQRRPRYTVTERPAALGGGWTLKLYQGGEEMGGGVFPPDDAAESPEQALLWAYNDAAAEGEEWVLSRQP